MSDVAYEGSLIRCKDEGHPRLFFFQVGNAEVAVCPRCEVRFIEDVTAGDGSEWDQSVRQEQGKIDAAIWRHPAGSASGTIECCEPRMLEFPSGRFLAHSRFCKEHKGERIDTKVYAQGRQWDSRRVRRLRG